MRFTDKPEMSFIDHLEELRGILIRIGICLLIIFPITAYFAQDLIDLLVRYSCPKGFELKYFSPLEPLWVQLKVAALVAIVIGLPYMAWQVWRFIAPGLYEHERNAAARISLVSWIMFLGGAAFAFKFIMPMLMKFSMDLQTDYVKPIIGLESFVSMTGMLLLGFGLMFQFPVAIYVLIRSGIVELATIRRQRPYIIVLVLVLAAILTPPDVVSQVMLAVPSYLMFEISLIIASFTCRKKKTETELEPITDGVALDDDDGNDDYSIEAQSMAHRPSFAVPDDDFRPEQVYKSSFKEKRRRIINISHGRRGRRK